MLTAGFALGFPADVWKEISFHLKQRHLLKLMLTCKKIKIFVDTEAYWERVATHLLWRDILTKIEGRTGITRGWFYMVNLDKGYRAVMDQFLKKLRMVLGGGPREVRICLNDETTKFPDWSGYVNASWFDLVPLVEQWRKETSTKDYVRDTYKIRCTNMKQVVARETKMSTDHMKPWMSVAQKCVNEIDDLPIPCEFKRMMMNSVQNIRNECLQRIPVTAVLIALDKF